MISRGHIPDNAAIFDMERDHVHLACTWIVMLGSYAKARDIG